MIGTVRSLLGRLQYGKKSVIANLEQKRDRSKSKEYHFDFGGCSPAEVRRRRNAIA